MAEDRMLPTGGGSGAPDPRQGSAPCPVLGCRYTLLCGGMGGGMGALRCPRCRRLVAAPGTPGTGNGVDVSGPVKGVRPLGPFTRGG